MPEIEKLAEVYRDFGNIRELSYPAGAFTRTAFFDEVLRKYFGELPAGLQAKPLVDRIPENIRTDFLIDFLVAGGKYRRQRR